MSNKIGMTPQEFAAKLNANPQIPTGADYHIAKAKAALSEMESVTRRQGLTASEVHYGFHYVGECLERTIKALELIQQERKERE